MSHRKTLPAAAGLLAAIALSLSGCSAAIDGGGTAAEAVTIDAASISPHGIVGKGKNGEEPAPAEALKLSDDD